MKAEFLPCDKCGIAGIHACPGSPPDLESYGNLEKLLSDVLEKDFAQKLGLMTTGDSEAMSQKPLTYEDIKDAHEALVKHKAKKAERVKWEYLNRPLRVTLTKDSFACLRTDVA